VKQNRKTHLQQYELIAQRFRTPISNHTTW